MDPKFITKSKTILFNLAIIVGSALVMFDSQVANYVASLVPNTEIAVHVSAIVLELIAIVSIILRLVTKTGVTLKKNE